MNILLSLTFFFLVFSLHAEVKLPRIFTDHAVFQRQKPIPVWGWANPGESVFVSLSSKSVNVKADKQGNWNVFLPAMEAGGPYSLRIIIMPT